MKRYAPGFKATKFLRLTSSIIIVLSLALPTRSCVTNGHAEISFPLSAANSVGSVVVVLALYLIPFLVNFAGPRFRTFATYVGIMSAAYNLFVSYALIAFSSSLLLGWYVNTLGNASYLLASVVEFWQLWARKRMAKRAALKKLAPTA